MKVRIVLAPAFLTAAVSGFSFPIKTASNAGAVPGRLTNNVVKSTVANSDQAIDDLLILSKKVGPVGSLASEEEREQMIEAAQKLTNCEGDENPAEASLRGVHNLLYSAAPGGSSGRLFGPVFGKVSQEFLEDDIFINSVKIGPLEIALQADKVVKDNMTNIVKFRKSIIKLFGNTIVEKEISGGGTWKYLYMGKVQGPDGKPRLLRVMETPSLFVIEQPLED